MRRKTIISLLFGSLRCRTFIAYSLGVIMGAWLHSSFQPSSHSTTKSGIGAAKKGSVKTLSETPIRNTVHVDRSGRAVTKQQLLEPFVIPNFVGFSVAKILPGQIMMPPHQHETMHEIFYILKGQGIFQVNGEDFPVSEGTFLHIAPGEKHGVWVPGEESTNLEMIVTGIAIGDKNKDTS